MLARQRVADALRDQLPVRGGEPPPASSPSGTVALVLVLLVLLARYVPATGGLLLVTAFRLVEWRRLRQALRASRYDSVLVAITALSAIFVSVEFSILTSCYALDRPPHPRAARLNATELSGWPRSRDPAPPPWRRALLVDRRDSRSRRGSSSSGAAPELDRLLEDFESSAAKGTSVTCCASGGRATPISRSAWMGSSTSAGWIGSRRAGAPERRPPRSERAMKSLRFPDWLAADRVFPSDPTAPGSSTVKAVRRAYELARRRPAGNVRSLRLDRPSGRRALLHGLGGREARSALKARAACSRPPGVARSATSRRDEVEADAKLDVDADARRPSGEGVLEAELGPPDEAQLDAERAHPHVPAAGAAAASVHDVLETQRSAPPRRPELRRRKRWIEPERRDVSRDEAAEVDRDARVGAPPAGVGDGPRAPAARAAADEETAARDRRVATAPAAARP